MNCDTKWIIRHELVYFGPFSVGLFSGECPKTKNKPWAHLWCLRFLKLFDRFPKISPELILGKPQYKFNWSSSRLPNYYNYTCMFHEYTSYSLVDGLLICQSV